MTPLILKPLSDLRMVWRQVVLAVVALVIGIWGIGGIFWSYTVLTHDLRENFVATRPAHAILVSSDFSGLDLAQLRKRPEIESAEFRDLSMQRIEVSPGEWIPLWLFGLEDAEHATLATLRPQQGTLSPGAGTLLVESDGLKISNLQWGAAARVRAAGRVVDMPVGGIVYDAAQAPATQDHFIYGYVDKPTYARISGQAINERLILRLKNVRDAAGVRHALAPLLADFRTRGIHLKSLQIPTFEAHPHQWQLDTLLLLQGAIGLLAFLMGAVLVSQLMASLLARQVREIGIMKAMGARRGQVLGLYAGMVLAMALFAGLIAVPLALASGDAFSSFVAGKLNFDILTTRLSVPIALALGAGSLLLPLGAALPVLLRGTNRSVVQALSDQATRGAASSIRRNLVIIITMALGVAIFDTGFNLRQSLAELLADMNRSMGHDLQIVLKKSVPPETVVPLMAGLPNLARVETWNGGRGELQSHVVATDRGIGIVALPWNTSLFQPRLAEGRWLQGVGQVEVVLNRNAVDLYEHHEIGRTIEVSAAGRTVQATLVGIIEELDKPKIYMDQSNYNRAFGVAPGVNSLMLVARDKRYSEVMALKRAVEAVIERSNLDVLYVMSHAERGRVIADHLDIVLAVLVILSLLVLMVSAMGMASALAISVQERTREIGIMRAIGATPAMVSRRLLIEGLQLGGASLVLGLIAAWPLGDAAAAAFGRLMLGENARLQFAFSPTGLLTVVVVTLIFAWAASRTPAKRALSIPTRDALAYA